MGEQVLLNKDLVVCCLTLLGSFAVAAFTYYKTKKLKFFDVYFDQKAKAYNDFIRAAAESLESGSNNAVELFRALYTAKMYCSKRATRELDSVARIVVRSDAEYDPKLFREAIERAIEIMRDDMQKCRKYKFE